jgi:phosphatidate cytidylyltransferase
LLKTRIYTAAVIAMVAFVLVFLAPAWIFRLFMAVLLIIGSWEFTRLAGLGRFSRWVLILLQTVILVLMTRYWDSISEHALAFLVAAVLSWCIMFLRLITFRPGIEPGLNYRLISFFCALASISFAWYAMAWLSAQQQGEFLILNLLFIIWAADIGAYFSGKRFGKNKLAPSISPGKTREGLLGGLVLAVAVSLLAAQLSHSLPTSLVGLIVVTVITALASAAGDLFISLHKRTVGLKDSGRLFPGHGGVLDRFDSLLAGAPFFALGSLILSL